MKYLFASIGATAIVYFAYWPTPISPMAWNAPSNPGYVRPFEQNDRLKHIEKVSIGDLHGPEDIAVDSQGRIYCATENGVIARLAQGGKQPEHFANTGGRPLGIAFDARGNLIVADSMRGLLSVSPAGIVSLLTDSADGVPIGYADDLDIAKDGTIYFSDASTKFRPKNLKDGFFASKLEILEHRGNGRLLAYDPSTKTTQVLLNGLHFANGVALSQNEDFVLVNETGAYRVTRYWLKGERTGSHDTFIDNLPGFPDNISRAKSGVFWLAMISPRSKVVDRLSYYPKLRQMILRLPKFMQPDAKRYTFALGLNQNGDVIYNLQDPNGRFAFNSSVKEFDGVLYFGSLKESAIGRLALADALL